ncbi:FAD-dependent monooxygenase [Salinicoccus kekensis]|uniref:2-polyprenyl-6-methoxyphenol hydroxylase-like FAD-dependent oxidoreductase n=1 Tax=Salinicoccus kekensis TaxID=714307 RepID=A0A285UNJ8_9STAP|nr:FAD-dependent monooxygenase [Salinicoccus kekensis]SOC43485.1 2-polyprenyl-6-methoxyphenol hydroxylase-like FAD-dependent oxidoreductase [Salinicoccus kekensis]
MEEKVLISGAGPSGLVLALALSRQGIPFTIIDKDDGPGTTSRAMAVHARTLEFYEQLGIANKIVINGMIVNKINFFRNKNHLADIPLGMIGQDLSEFPYILILPQDVHEEILVDALNEAGHEVKWQHELKNFKDDGETVEVEMETPEGTVTENFAYLCGCDGASSTVRKALDIDFTGGTYDPVFFVADVENGTFLENPAVGFHEEDFCLGFPIRTMDQVRLIGLIPDEYMEDGEAPEGFSGLAAHAESILPVKVEQVNWYSSYRSHHRVAESFRKGRVFLVGDAGHIHSPVGGQGMNTGIGDAVNLSWKLSAVLKGRAAEDILHTYEKERIKFAHTLLQTTDRMFNFMVNKQRLRNFIIPVFIPRILRFSNMKDRLFRTISQIHVDYRESDLSGGATGKVKGGDRLPWTGRGEANNFRPLRSLDWQIHAYGEAGDEVASFAEEMGFEFFHMSWEESFEDTGMEEDSVYLIRPDGHISVAVKPENVEDIRAMVEKYSIQRLH